MANYWYLLCKTCKVRLWLGEGSFGMHLYSLFCSRVYKKGDKNYRKFDSKGALLETCPEAILFLLAHNGHEFALVDAGGAQIDHLEEWKKGSLTLYGDKNHKWIDFIEFKEVHSKDLIPDSKK